MLVRGASGSGRHEIKAFKYGGASAVLCLCALGCSPDVGAPDTDTLTPAAANAPIRAADSGTIPPDGAREAQLSDSRLAFVGVQAGAPFEGVFRQFGATVSIDEADLGGSFIEAQIDTASAATNNAERDETLLGADFFDVKKWPWAHYRSTSIRRDGAGYIARGPLTLRGQTHPVAVNFRYTAATGARPGRLLGEAHIRRLRFGVGAGEWADTEAIADEVRIEIDLALP